MKKLFICLAIFSLASPVFAAITERYVTAASADTTWSDSTSSSTPVTLSTAIANATAGDRVNIKNDGTYTRSATDTVTNAGTATSPIIWRGYHTTPGDGNLGRTNSNGALITTNLPLISYNSGFKVTFSNYNLVESLDIENATTAGTTTLVALGNNNALKSCKVVNVSTNSGAIGISAGTINIVFDNDVTASGSGSGPIAIQLGSTNSRCLFNRVTASGATGTGISVGGNSSIIGNAVYLCGGNAINSTSTSSLPLIMGNTLTGNGGDAINHVTGTTALICDIDNMLTDNTGYGINGVSAANPVFAAYNRTRDNTAGATNLATDWLSATRYGAVTTDTGGPETDYVDSTTKDYRLISASPGKAAGWLPFTDIGALQRQESAAGATQTSRVSE